MRQATTLDKAIQSLRELPPAEQTHVAEKLIEYATRFRELKAGIDKATRQIENGETIEINDVNETVESIANKHGKA